MTIKYSHIYFIKLLIIFDPWFCIKSSQTISYKLILFTSELENISHMFYWREDWLPVADADCTASVYKPQKMASSDESNIVCLKEEYIVYYHGKSDIIDLTMDENEDDTSCITHMSETWW